MRPIMGPPIKTVPFPWLDPHRVIPDMAQAPDRLWTRLYIQGMDEDLEKLYGFRPGGTVLFICKMSFMMASTA